MPPAVAAAGIGAAGMLGGSLLGRKSQNDAIAAQRQQQMWALQQSQNFMDQTAARLGSGMPSFDYTRPGGYGSVNMGMLGNPQAVSRFLATPQYQQSLSNVTGLARLLQGGGAGLYNVGSDTYKAGLDYYKQILGGNQAAMARAIAPQASAITDTGAGAQRALEASGLRGGARDVARAQLIQQTAGQLGNLGPQAIQNAAQAGSQLGLAGAQAGGQMEQAAGGLGTQVAGLEQARQQAAAQTALGAKGLELQQLLGMRGLDVNERLGLGQLATENYLGRNQLINQAAAIPYGALQVGLQGQQMANQQGYASGNAWGGLFGQLGNAATQAYGNWYNNRGAGAMVDPSHFTTQGPQF